MLKCPKCNGKLYLNDKMYRCNQNHCYDVAKEGYVNLVLNYNQESGDNKFLIEARNEFLRLGYYNFLRETLIEMMSLFPNEIIVDAGCGEGYYTNEFSKHFPNVIGIDLSKHGIKKASKNSDAIYLINSIQNIALCDQSSDMVLSIFSYRNLEEFHRILKEDGYYIEVVPDENHLVELKKVVYDEVYLNKEEAEAISYFEKIDRIYLQDKKELTQEELQLLFKMTPYYFKTSLKDKEKLEKIEKLIVTFAFIVNVYVKKEVK